MVARVATVSGVNSITGRRKMKTKFTEEQLSEISKLQARDGITRKAAVKKYSRLLKAANKAIAATTKAKSPKVPDYKQAAANDRPEPPKPTTPAGDARAVGIALYKTAGRPAKQQFIHVY